MKRRTFIQASAYASLLGLSGLTSCNKSSSPLNVLVLGGTYFVGPAIVNAFLSSGHTVTLFNRGITNPDLFSQLPLIIGDREQGIASYDPLKDQKWDIVVDVWPEKAQLVEESVEALKDHASFYQFISSIAVYNDFQEVGLHEESNVIGLPDDRSKWYYSEEKLAAENVVRNHFPDNHTILRCGPIKGWRDPAVDLLYWCLRLKEDKIIAPGSGDDFIQFIDVKDVGKFTAQAYDQKLSGTFNLTGPMAQQLKWNTFLNLLITHFDSSTSLIWADEAFLRKQEIYSFSDLPLWAPLSEDRGFMQISNNKLVNTGFQFTSIEETLADCMLWHDENERSKIAFGTQEVGVGLTKEKEEELLELLDG